MEGEKVSRRQVEVSVQIYCYKLVTRGLMSELLIPIADDVRGTWLQLMCCTLPKCLCA